MKNQLNLARKCISFQNKPESRQNFFARRYDWQTLLYSPELKFYSNKVKMDENLDTNIRGLHCLGDSSGWTRGLMMASVMGVLMGRKLAEKEGC